MRLALKFSGYQYSLLRKTWGLGRPSIPPGISAALLPPQRQSSFQATASLLLSVALAKNTAAILLDRTEAALHGDYGYTKLSDAAWADQSLADWTSAECGAWARDPVANELAYV